MASRPTSPCAWRTSRNTEPFTAHNTPNTMHTTARLLAIALLMATAWPATPAAAQRRVPGDPAVLRAHRANTGLFGPRTRKVTLPLIEVDQLPTPDKALANLRGPNEHPGIPEPEVVSPDPLHLYTLRAVVVVGPSDGYTALFTDEMREVTALLRGHGVEVSTFYHPEAQWADVARAAQGADIFIYSGHGVAYDRRGNKVGGLALSDGIVDPDTTAAGLGLREGGLVLFSHVCYSAGSSSNDQITLRQAHQRVSCYATPFMVRGAGAYYAINTLYRMEYVLMHFLNGMPLDAIGFPSPPNTRPLQLPGRITDKEVMVGSYIQQALRPGYRSNEYDVAFVGPRRYTIHQLLERP